MKRLRYKIAAMCLCAVMFFAYAAEPMYAAANTTLESLQNQAANINDRLAQLEREQREIQANIAGARSQLEREREIKANIDRQIAITREEIELIEEKIGNLRQEIELKEEEIWVKEGEIDVKEGEIDVKQCEHDASYELFRQRLRAMYMFGDASVIGLIFGAESFVDFLSRTDTITRVAEHDRQLMQKLTSERIALEGQRSDLEEERAGLDLQRGHLEERRAYEEGLRDEAEEKRAVLTVQTQQAAIRIQDVADLERQFNADLAAAQARQREMENELQEVLKQIEWSTNPYIGGELLWPLPGFTQITSNFGTRFGGRDYHTGVDIAGSNIHGKPVVAANAGTVVIANTSFTPGRGYGIYVVLDHGGRVSTYYAHLSSISVKVGDVVRRGQEVGKVGSTGWSTGPHLHFEYRENDQPIDPMTKYRR